MKMVDILVTDVGEFPCPPSLTVSGLKLRRDRQPDRRTSAGKDWYKRFRKFQDDKLAEYLATSKADALSV